MKLSHLAETLVGSEIVKLGNQIKERMRQGEHIYNFTIGDFDSSVFPIPQELEDEIVAAYKHHFTTYPAAEGILELRQSVSQFLKEREGLEYGVNEIQIAAGGRPLIYSIFRALVDKGDKVIYAAPSWNNNHYAYLTSANAVEVKTTPENNFLPTADDLRPHLDGAVLLALCSPLNPTGTMFTKDQLSEICELVLAENKKRGDDEKPLYLMYDQIYSNLTFGEEHVDPVSLFPEMKEYTVYIDGISKCLAATGVRVGWGFGPAHIMDKMKALLTQKMVLFPNRPYGEFTQSMNTANFEKEIFIYPNPVKNRIFIKTDQIISSYKIYNVVGQMVLANIFSGSIDISMLEKGTYFLNLDNFKSKSFIKTVLLSIFPSLSVSSNSITRLFFSFVPVPSASCV